ncbi:MAG: hypothetical protein K6357_08425 [Elusimicrobiota bacterium]
MDIRHIAEVIYCNILKEVDVLDKDAVKRKLSEPQRKVFIGDWELRKKYFKNNEIVLPATSIVSPLSIERIKYNSVGVIGK